MYDFEKIAEIRHSQVVLEVFEKGAAPKNYFDVKCQFEALSRASGRHLSGYIPVKYAPDLIVAVVRGMEFISEQHRSTRSELDRYAPQVTPSVSLQWEDYELLSTGFDFKLLKEVKCGVAVTTLFEDPNGVYYLKCEREYAQGGSWVRSDQLQQRNLRDLVISIAESWSHYSQQGD